VYGQFHYAVDALAGLGVGAIVAIGFWLVFAREAAARVDPDRREAPQPVIP
jgi:membrane-associated phospholipid phosphatase